MIKLAIILLFFVASCCTAKDTAKNVSIGELLVSTSSYNGMELWIVGKLTIKENQTFDLSSFEESEGFIDMVFIDNTKERELLENFYDECIQVKGVFKEYNKDFIGLGNLTSRYGVIEANSYSKCD